MNRFGAPNPIVHRVPKKRNVGCKNPLCRDAAKRGRAYRAICEGPTGWSCHQCFSKHAPRRAYNTTLTEFHRKVQIGPALGNFSEFHLIWSLWQYADQWLRQSTAARMHMWKGAYYRNMSLLRSVPALQRFFRAFRVLDSVVSGSNKLIFAWHGTRQINITDICHDGFDPRYRRSQLFGPGEYFALDHRIANAHAQPKNLLVLCAVIVSCPQFRANLDYGVCVVNNPMNRYMSFCIPLLIVYFTKPTLHSKEIKLDTPTPYGPLHKVTFFPPAFPPPTDFEVAAADDSNSGDTLALQFASSVPLQILV